MGSWCVPVRLLLLFVGTASRSVTGSSEVTSTPYRLLTESAKITPPDESAESPANGTSTSNATLNASLDRSENISLTSMLSTHAEVSPSPFNETATEQPQTATTLTTILVKTVEDHHKYYKSQVMASEEISKYWIDEKIMYKAAKHQTLSESYRSAATISLSFPFMFYGHEVNQVTIATGGFLYMSEFLHQWLTATQYIAPLMANFDTQIGNNSHIRYLDNGTVFVVWWEDVHLQDDFSAGHFNFQVMLHKNSSIIFSYKEIPSMALTKIPSQRHPVKVGLSDAYYMDKPTSSVLHLFG